MYLCRHCNIWAFARMPLPKGEPFKMPVKKTAEGTSSPTVTLRHLAARLADNHSVPKKHAETILADLVALVSKHLKKGDRIRIAGLGISAGSQARCSHGPQSRDRRGDQDQGKQEGRL